MSIESSQFYSMLQATPPVVIITTKDLPRGWYFRCFEGMEPKTALSCFRDKLGIMPIVIYHTGFQVWIPERAVAGQVPDDLFLVAPDQTS